MIFFAEFGRKFVAMPYLGELDILIPGNLLYGLMRLKRLHKRG
jgi:hypothetical protein